MKITGWSFENLTVDLAKWSTDVEFRKKTLQDARKSAKSKPRKIVKIWGKIGKARTKIAEIVNHSFDKWSDGLPNVNPLKPRSYKDEIPESPKQTKLF